ncbi:MAG: hypothetical protein BGO68_00970 [Candidatus Amoebophilus sp. 36-38]|nr:MAG: hypothetical protein BGO68_00970 [Candidatus Amoebophilus sp. 36-38]
MKSNNKVAIIIGSTRPNRIGEQVARWVLNEVVETEGMEFKLVDLAAWRLPMLDEPSIPAYGKYIHEHTKKWSAEISSYQAFIFVTPQYNWGYPASLKNALDYLYKEWEGKPAIIVSYAHRGGGRAASQLRQVLEGGFKMKVTPTMPAISFTKEILNEKGKLKNPALDFISYSSMVRQSVDELKNILSSNLDSLSTK